jgi:hypothetical protein
MLILEDCVAEFEVQRQRNIPTGWAERSGVLLWLGVEQRCGGTSLADFRSNFCPANFSPLHQLTTTFTNSPLRTMSHPSLRLLRIHRLPVPRLFSSPFRPLAPRTTLQSSRSASTAAADARSLVTRLKNLLFGSSIFLFGAFSYLYITDTRAGVHQWLAVPALRWVYPDAEDAHHAGTKTLKALYSFGLHPRERVWT